MQGVNMEILRFNEAASTTPQRKKSSRGMIALGLVATLFGVGSALASTTITINSDTNINVGQGVSEVTRCDNAINIAANSGLYTPGNSKKPKFYFSGVTFSGVNQNAYTGEDDEGCGGQIFDFQIWKKTGTGDLDTAAAYTCGQLGLKSKGTDIDEDDLNDLLNEDNSDYAVSAVSCLGSVVTIVVPVRDTTSGTFKVPFAKYVNLPKDQILDISYFTLSSRTPTV